MSENSLKTPGRPVDPGEPWTLEKQSDYTAYFVAHGRREYVGPWPGAEG